MMSLVDGGDIVAGVEVEADAAAAGTSKLRETLRPAISTDPRISTRIFGAMLLQPV